MQKQSIQRIDEMVRWRDGCTGLFLFGHWIIVWHLVPWLSVPVSDFSDFRRSKKVQNNFFTIFFSIFCQLLVENDISGVVMSGKSGGWAIGSSDDDGDDDGCSLLFLSFLLVRCCYQHTKTHRASYVFVWSKVLPQKPSTLEGVSVRDILSDNRSTECNVTTSCMPATNHIYWHY